MNRNTAHIVPSSRARIARLLRDRAVCQALEARRLLAINITWANRATTDNFGIYGADAGQARTIVDRAINDWEAVITSFNRSGGSENFTLNITAAPIDGRGSTGGIGTTNGKPSSANISMDDNGDGAGWYFDPFVGVDGIPDDGEFTTPILPFTSGDIGTTADFYRTAAHEMGHAMGVSDFGLLGALTSDVGDDPNSGNPDDRLFGVDIGLNGSFEYTLTNNTGTHLFEGGGGYSGPVHPNSLMNPGRTYVTGRRQLIGDVESDLLRDAWGYTVVSPNSINTFWANLNRTTNVLTVTGDINPSGSDVDSIIVDVIGTDTRIRVGGTSELIPNAEYTTLVINAGEAGDTIRIDGLPAGKNVTVNAGNGNDLIVLSEVTQDLDTGLESDVSINGGAGTDSIRADDQTDSINSDIYTVTSTSLVKGSVEPHTFTINADIEQLTVNGSAQPSTWNITSTSFNLIVNAGSGNDTFNVGGGDVDTNIVGTATINGGGGTDRIDFEDASDGPSGDNWTFAVGSLNKGGQVVNYSAMEGLVVNASAQANTYNLDAHGSSTPITINGGAGNETFLVGNGDLDTNIDSNATLNGGGGTDSVTFEDSTDGSGSNIYTLTATQLVKSIRTFNYSGFESLVITGSALAATYSINGSSSAATIVNGGAGADTVNVGGGDVDTNLGTNITVNGGGGADVLTFDDSADGAGANTATFTNGQIVKGAQLFVYTSFVSLLWQGAAMATTYNVNGTTPGTPVTINGGAGNDTFNVGGGDYDSNINGEVRIVGNGGVDRVVINDTADQNAPVDTYEVNGGSFTKSSATGIDVSFSSPIIGGAPTIEEFVLNASNFDSTINVNSTGGQSIPVFPNPPTIFPVAVTVNAGDGADAINVAPSGNLNLIRGNINIIGGAGVDALTINDFGDADNDPFFITHAQLTNTDWGYTAQYSSASESLTVNTGSGSNIINFDAAAAGPANVFLNGNGGVDNFEISGGTATVNGGAGLDNVDVNEDEVNTAQAVFAVSQDLGALRIFAGGTATVAVNGSTILDTNTAGTLRGTLNVNNNTAVVRSPSLTFLIDKLARGYNAGAWNGVPAGGQNGAITSGTANSTALSDGVGYAEIGAAAGQLNQAVVQGANVVAGNVVMTYTLSGDTNLDRTVGFPDLVSLAQNYNLVGTNWAQGNFNYDNVTDFADLVPLAQNYNASVLQASVQTAELDTWPLGRGEKERLAKGSRVSAALLERAWDERRKTREKLA
jgi:hypothetical protein